MDQHEYERMGAVQATHWWYRSTRALLEQITAEYGDLGRGLWLDSGCGTGATGGWLQHERNVIALDLSTHALRLYRTQHSKSLAEINGDIARLPIRDAAIAGILCVTVLYHAAVEDPAATVRELARVLRPGGVLVLLEPGVRRLRRPHDRGTAAARRFAVNELAELVTSAGLECLRSTGAYSFLVPPAVIDALVHPRAMQSDLARPPSLADHAFTVLARIERRWLAQHDLPWGLSVVAVGRKSQSPLTFRTSGLS